MPSELRTVLSIADETGADAHLVTAHAGLAAIAFGREDLATARSHLSSGYDAMLSGFHLFGIDVLLWLMATDGFRARGCADVPRALGALGDKQHHAWTHAVSLIAPDLVKAAVAAGRIDAAEVVATEVEAFATRSIGAERACISATVSCAARWSTG